MKKLATFGTALSLFFLIFTALGCDGSNSKIAVKEFPNVSFERYGNGTALARYSSPKTQGDSSSYDCVFREELISIDLDTNHFSKQDTIRLIEFVTSKFSSAKNVDLALNYAVVDFDVLTILLQMNNLACLDMLNSKLSVQQIDVILKMKHLKYLRIRQENLSRDSLDRLRKLGKFKLLIVPSDGTEKTSKKR